MRLIRVLCIRLIASLFHSLSVRASIFHLSIRYLVERIKIGFCMISFFVLLFLPRHITPRVLYEYKNTGEDKVEREHKSLLGLCYRRFIHEYDSSSFPPFSLFAFSFLLLCLLFSPLMMCIFRDEITSLYIF